MDDVISRFYTSDERLMKKLWVKLGFYLYWVVKEKRTVDIEIDDENVI